jgi:YtxH-like protein
MFGTQKGRKDIFMRNSGYKNRLIDWSRFAVRIGLILTDPKVRDEINDQLKTRVDRVTDTITSKYEDASDRLTAAGAALQGKDYYRPSRVFGFLLGVGVGASLGLLLAPAAGTETREAIREKAVEIKNKVVESTASVRGQARRSVSSMPPTGTEG